MTISTSDLRELLATEAPDAVLVLVEGRTAVHRRTAMLDAAISEMGA
jgi:hypothetical protein